MRRLFLLLVVLLLCAPMGAPYGVAHAQESESTAREDALRERIELIRKLPPEEQRRLRDALRRFKSLPEEQRRELTRRAETVGPERLRELVGRDVERLRRRRGALRREQDEIVRLLGGQERFAALEDVERRYLVSLAVRNFQKHVRRTLLDIAGPGQMEAFARLPRDERKQKMEVAVRQLVESLLAAETPESRAEILGLPPHEQRRRRMELLAEHRLALVPSFVSGFERQRVLPFLQLPPDERRAAAERWAERARWFEIRQRLERELGVSREALGILARLGPEDCARVRDEYDRTEHLSAAERRLHLEDEIRKLEGGAALSDEARAPNGRERLRWLLRDQKRRRQRERRATDPDGAR